MQHFQFRPNLDVAKSLRTCFVWINVFGISENPVRLCACPAHQARVEESCVRCLPPEQRCHSVHSSKLSKSECADGYVGVMCMDCAWNFYAAGRACKECQDYDLEFPNPWLFAPVIVIVIVVLPLWLWRRRNTEPEVQEVRCKSFFTELKEQIQAQGPILLQHCRWAMSTLSFCLFHFCRLFLYNFLQS